LHPARSDLRSGKYRGFDPLRRAPIFGRGLGRSIDDRWEYFAVCILVLRLEQCRLAAAVVRHGTTCVPLLPVFLAPSDISLFLCSSSRVGPWLMFALEACATPPSVWPHSLRDFRFRFLMIVRKTIFSPFCACLSSRRESFVWCLHAGHDSFPCVNPAFQVNLLDRFCCFIFSSSPSAMPSVKLQSVDGPAQNSLVNPTVISFALDKSPGRTSTVFSFPLQTQCG